MTPIRIAAWSGPRNISTAMMRAWENRDDCVVSDEPMYAHYLQVTQLDHPARDEVIAAGDTDLQHVVDTLRGPVPERPRGLVPEAHEPPPAARHGLGLGARPDEHLPDPRPGAGGGQLREEPRQRGADRHRAAAAGANCSTPWRSAWARRRR
jgi:hypothetical protein